MSSDDDLLVTVNIEEETPGRDEEPGENEFEDEEACEMDAFQVEEDVLMFTDECCIEHNIYPESDNDEDQRFKDRRNDEELRHGSGYLQKGMTFFNGVAFKEVVVDYVLRTARNLQQYRYDKQRIAYKCASKGCDWRIYCSVTGNSNAWKIRVFNNVHSCIPNGKCVMMKVQVIARLFVDNIRDEPEYFMPKKMVAIMFEKWGINVSRHQCQAARNTSLKWIETEYAQQFSRLRDYASEILVSNANSTVSIDTVMNREGHEVFNRFYVCFDVLRRTWRESCRPLIGVDGCFLRSKMKGQLLVALGRDADNRIYPIAWGCVQVENTENWAWFVRKLKDDLGLMNGDGFIIISDRQKGLINAVQALLPRIEPWMKQLIWNLAWSYNDVEFNENLDRILNYDTIVFQDVMKTNPQTWCRAFFKLGNHCEDVDNNSTESFNASIVKAREKPMVPMLETIRRLAMVRINIRHFVPMEHKGICTPYVAKLLAKEHKRAAESKFSRSTNSMFEVEINGCSHRVSLERMTCTCKKYDICGIPCEHAYGAILHKKLQPEDYVSLWFHTETWKRNYAEGLVPLRGTKFWPDTGAPNIHEPPPAAMPGRPKRGKEKRIRGRNESPTRNEPRQLKRVMYCRICHQPGHNSRFHNSRAAKGSSQSQSTVLVQGESSQGTVTQQCESSQGTMTQLQRVSSWM